MNGFTLSSPSSISRGPILSSISVENQLNAHFHPHPVPPCPRRKSTPTSALPCTRLVVGSRMVIWPPIASALSVWAAVAAALLTSRPTAMNTGPDLIPSALARPGPNSSSEGAAGHPFAHQGVDHREAIAVARDQVISYERGQRGLNRRRPAEAMARANVGSVHPAAVLEDDGAQNRALRQREVLPCRLDGGAVLCQ